MPPPGTRPTRTRPRRSSPPRPATCRTPPTAPASLARGGESESNGEILEIAGPREENLAAMASLLAARRGDPARVEEVGDYPDPDAELLANGTLLPGPNAVLAGPTFEEWLDPDSEPARPAGATN